MNYMLLFIFLLVTLNSTYISVNITPTVITPTVITPTVITPTINPISLLILFNQI